MGPHAPVNAPAHAPVYHHYAPPYYHYTYNVLDDYAGLNYGHQEDQDGGKTIGEYHVLLPDGRIQTVNYHVDDDYSGKALCPPKYIDISRKVTFAFQLDKYLI